MSENEWTKILGWPGYRVYRSEIDEGAKRLRLWVRRKRGNRKLECSGCGQRIGKVAEVYEREVRDLPWSEYRTTVVIELYRVRCPDCGIKAEKVPQLPSKAPFSKRFEEAVGLACESAAVRRVARQFGLSSSTVRAIDVRYLKRWRRVGGSRRCGRWGWTRFTWSLSTLAALLRQQLFFYRDLWVWLDDPFQSPPALAGVHDDAQQLGITW
jgi:transposase